MINELFRFVFVFFPFRFVVLYLSFQYVRLTVCKCTKGARYPFFYDLHHYYCIYAASLFPRPSPTLYCCFPFFFFSERSMGEAFHSVPGRPPKVTLLYLTLPSYLELLLSSFCHNLRGTVGLLSRCTEGWRDVFVGSEWHDFTSWITIYSITPIHTHGAPTSPVRRGKERERESERKREVAVQCCSILYMTVVRFYLFVCFHLYRLLVEVAGGIVWVV